MGGAEGAIELRSAPWRETGTCTGLERSGAGLLFCRACPELLPSDFSGLSGVLEGGSVGFRDCSRC